jgi:AsmA protein
MAKRLIVAGAIVVGLVVLAVVGVGLFLDPNQFRPRLEAMISEALARQVTIGNLKVAWLSGGIAAEDVLIADDPAFSREPFVSAQSVAIGVDLMPLIVSRSLNVRSFTLDRPKVALLRSPSGTWNFSSLGGGSKSSSAGPVGTMNVLVQQISIASGQIVVGGLDGRRDEHSYDSVDVRVSNVSLTSKCPFTMSAKTPGGGTISVDGEAGPVNVKDIAQTPFHGALTIKHLNVAETGFIDPASGIAGIVDFSGTLTSNGEEMSTKGKATASGIRLLPGAGTSREPVAIDYESIYNSKSQAGKLTHADVHIGTASARVTGDYRTSGRTTNVRMTLKAAQMPVTDLEGALPAIGVTLPPGASLKQGALNVTLGIDGPIDRLTIAGPLALSDGKMAGFDLGAKLGAIAALAGLQHVGDTLIQTLSATVHMAPEGIRIGAVDMVAPAIGTLTGDGTISPKSALDFAMLAKVKNQALGVPFRIQGTTSNPTFAPDVGRLARSATDELKNAVKNPDEIKKAADTLSSLFGRKKQ